MKRYFVDLPDPDLAYLVEGTPEFDAYITAMLWAQEYAELLTADGQWVKAPVLSFGRQEVSEVTLSRSGVIKTIRATAEHRWLLRSRRGHGYEATTTELQPGDRLQFTFPPRPNGLHVDLLAAARGFVYGDGHRHGNRSAANFRRVEGRRHAAAFRGPRLPAAHLRRCGHDWAPDPFLGIPG